MSDREQHSKVRLPTKVRLLSLPGASWTTAFGAVVLAIISGLLFWIIWPRFSEIQLLGSPQATRSPQPITAVGDAPARDSTLPRSATATAEGSEQPHNNSSSGATGMDPASIEHVLVEQKIIDAFSCARAERGLSAYKRNDHLSNEANTILQRVQREPESPFGDKQPGYSLTGQLLIDFEEPSTTPCSLGGFDVATVDGLESSSRIGVAVAPLTIYDRIVYLTIIVGQ